MDTPPTVVILGPTAGGKSELAVELAEHLNGEVLGADSMQVYRHLDAGTAKPEPELRERAPHHLIDIIEPTERFTAADWLARARATIADLRARGKRPIVVGGTNLYLKLLLEGMFDAPARGNDPGYDPAYRASLDAIPTADLHARLQKVDPLAAERLHPNDRRRLVRALEVHHLTGHPISSLQTQWHKTGDENLEPADFILIGLDWPRDAINPRINQRVKQMFFPTACGLAPNEPLPDEVRRLEAANLLGTQAREALGYKQVLATLAAERGRPADRRIRTLDDAFEQTKVLTRRFAKQQRTWLRRYENVHWLPAAELSPPTLTDRALASLPANR